MELRSNAGVEISPVVLAFTAGVQHGSIPLYPWRDTAADGSDIVPSHTWPVMETPLI